MNFKGFLGEPYLILRNVLFGKLITSQTVVLINLDSDKTAGERQMRSVPLKVLIFNCRYCSNLFFFGMQYHHYNQTYQSEPFNNQNSAYQNLYCSRLHLYPVLFVTGKKYSVLRWDVHCSECLTLKQDT